MASKSFLVAFLAIWLSFTVCLAEEPTFPYPTEEESILENQYIVEFERNAAGNKMREMIMVEQNNEGKPKLIRKIKGRNISVIKFPSGKAAERWRMQKPIGIKFFEKDTLVWPWIGGTRKLAETTPYGIGHVQAEDVPDTNSGSRKVCIIDSGYDRAHEDLPDDPALVTGASFVGNRYPWYEDDNGGHGTHVAGTIAAKGGNSVGVKGVIRNGLLKIHAVRVFPPSGSTSTSTIIAGFQECIDAEANVINMSLGGGGPLNSFQDAIDDAHSKGILVFAASGNTGRSRKQYPASYNHVTSVASITESYTKSSFSTYNDAVDIAAPGSNVLSTLPGNRYAEYSGTSMACPHAAGVAALVWSNFPSLPANTIISTLEATALDLPLNANDGKDVNFGHGLIQAKAAYDALLPLLFPTASPAPSAMPVEFCPDGVVVQVDIQTDRFGSETSWDITDSNGDVVASQTSFSSNQFTSETFCLDETATCGGSDYTFTIYDTFGDGLCCRLINGYYEVYVDGDLAANGASFGSSESTSLCGPETTDPPTTSPTISPTAIPTTTCSLFDKRKACNNAVGCAWESNGQGGGSCQEGLFCPGKRKPCLETDGCFWQNNGDGTGRCKQCSTISKKNNCDLQTLCEWIDGACV